MPWAPTPNQIIERAFGKLGVDTDNQALTGHDLKRAVFALNALTRNLMMFDVPVWVAKEASITLVSGTATYATAVPALQLLDAWVGTEQLPVIDGVTYMSLVQRSDSSPAIYFTRTTTGSSVTLNPTPTAAGTLRVRLAYPFEDWDQASDTNLVPPEWIDPLVWGLASALAPEYGIPGDEQTRLEQRFDRALAHARLGTYVPATMIAR